jgi:MFS family permease
VIGAAVIARRLPDHQLVPAVLAASVVLGVAVGFAAAIALLIPAILLFAVGGAANGVQSVSMRSLIVHRVEDRYRGRVFAAYGGLTNGMQLVATAAAGGLLILLSGRAVLLIGGVGCATAGIVGVLWYRMLPADVRGTPEPEPKGRHVHVSVPDSGSVMRLPDAPPPVDATSDR